MLVIIKRQFPKYSQYLLLMDFALDLAVLSKYAKIVLIFFFHMKENK